MSPARQRLRVVKALLVFFTLFMLPSANAQDVSTQQDDMSSSDHTPEHQQSTPSASSSSSSSSSSYAVAKTNTMSTALGSPAEASFDDRLRRLERLVAERRDIVEDYNLQQLDETPLSTLLKNYLWKVVSSRPIFRFREDPR